MDTEQTAEIMDLLEEALTAATEAAGIAASALGLGEETEDGLEVDADTLEASDDPIAQAIARALTALDDARALFEDGATDEGPADGEDDAEAA